MAVLDLTEGPDHVAGVATIRLAVPKRVRAGPITEDRQRTPAAIEQVLVTQPEKPTIGEVDPGKRGCPPPVSGVLRHRTRPPRSVAGLEPVGEDKRVPLRPQIVQKGLERETTQRLQSHAAENAGRLLTP